MQGSDTTPLFEGLLPHFVAVAERRIDAVAGAPWPEEQAHVAQAVSTRQAEFAAGRILARRALAELGGHSLPIPAGPDRAPQWPAGFVGSITHSKDYVAAAVARTADAGAIGIDIAEIGRMRPALESKILLPVEIAANLTDLDRDARRTAFAVLFSAKEAFFKCQFPLTKARLGFDAAEIVLEDGIFRLSLRVDALPFLTGRMFEGRYAVKNGLAVTAMLISP